MGPGEFSHLSLQVAAAFIFIRLCYQYIPVLQHMQWNTLHRTTTTGKDSGLASETRSRLCSP